MAVAASYLNQSEPGPLGGAFTITTSDSTVLARPTRAVYVGGAGNLAVRMAGDQSTPIFIAVPVGTVLPSAPTRSLPPAPRRRICWGCTDMPFDPRTFRNKDGIGMPSDDAATDSTSAWTMVALLKGIWAKLNGTITVAGFPASLGQKAMSASLAVTMASDQATFPVSPAASSATGGIASTGRLLSAAGTSGDATNVKASAGRLYAIQGYNAAAAVRYLKLYNSASAPTAGSGTPVKTLALPPASGFAFDWPLGYSFSTGIGFTLVTGSADNSSTSVTAADILGLNLDYV
jgi:hypothetical protein